MAIGSLAATPGSPIAYRPISSYSPFHEIELQLARDYGAMRGAESNSAGVLSLMHQIGLVGMARSSQGGQMDGGSVREHGILTRSRAPA